MTIKIQDNIIGYTLSKPVFNKLGYLIVPEGKQIDNHIYEMMLHHDVDIDKLMVEALLDAEAHYIIPKPLLKQAVEHVKATFEKAIMQEMERVFNGLTTDDLESMRQIVDELLLAIEKSPHMTFTMMKLIDNDNYTFQHCVQVAILSILTARSMHLSDADIRDIALGGLLHDIGKIKIDNKIITKPDRLTNDELKIVRSHSELGYQLIEHVDSISQLVKDIVRYHHEKLDGSGYPIGLSEDKITTGIRIVTICDMYDAMTSDRIYRKQMPIYRAIDILMAECIYRIDHLILNHLISNICLYPPGSGVVLSDGRMGIIASVSRINPLRPRIRIIDMSKPLDYKSLEIVNLMQEKTLFIEESWDVDTYCFVNRKSDRTLRDA